MPHVFAQVRIPHRSGIAEDGVINTFHFTGVDDLTDMADAITLRLRAFYTGVPAPETYAIGRYLSGELQLAGARIKYYDWDDPEPRAPFMDVSAGLVESARAQTSNMPGEVALCSSYRGSLQSGTIAARRRGRVYLGPLNVGASVGATVEPARPDGTFRAIVARASEQLAAASTLGARWVVWSRVNSEAVPIRYGWVDNAFDTMRKRGVKPSTRSNWQAEVPGPG